MAQRYVTPYFWYCNCSVVMAHIHRKVVALLSEEPSKRSDLEINLLLPWFQSMSSLFKSQKTDVVKDILRNCEFRSVPRDDVIITQGERGDSFYIILGGAVSVYINQTLEEQGNLEETKLQSEATNPDEDHVTVDCNGNELDACDVTTSEPSIDKGCTKSTKSICMDRSHLVYIFGNLACILECYWKSQQEELLCITLILYSWRVAGPGKSFGELALVQTNLIRNASVIADYSTDLIVIDRELYSRSLKAAQKQEVQAKLEFVSSHDLFSNWTRRQRAVLTMSLMKGRYQYGNAIIRQGAPTEALIFITKGQAKVTVNPAKLIQQYPSMCRASDLDRSRQTRFDRVHSRKHKRQSPVADDPTNGITGPKHVHEICIVGPPDYVGDFEVLLRLPTYTQTVTSMEEVETLELDLTSFSRLIAKKKPSTYHNMHYIAEMKLISRLKRLQNDRIHNPILEQILQRFTEFNSSFQDNPLTLDPEDSSYDPHWYQYRTKQRQFLHNRRTARAAKKRQESRRHNTLLHQSLKLFPEMKIGGIGSKVSETDRSDAESEILPVISHNKRININPASGLVRLPRRMYSLDDPPPRTRRLSIAMVEGLPPPRSRRLSTAMVERSTRYSVAVPSDSSSL